jgi:hypothetical protein
VARWERLETTKEYGVVPTRAPDIRHLLPGQKIAFPGRLTDGTKVWPGDFAVILRWHDGHGTPWGRINNGAPQEADEWRWTPAGQAELYRRST